jgi:hypothetical protein
VLKISLFNKDNISLNDPFAMETLSKILIACFETIESDVRDKS